MRLASTATIAALTAALAQPVSQAQCAERAEATVAANAINALGVELLALAPPGLNALLSPYSIQIALAMTYAGADGVTRDEMARVLHYPADDATLHGSFGALTAELDDIAGRSVEAAARDKQSGGPIVLAVANRLYAQQDYEFLPAFLALVEEKYRASLQPANFKDDSEGERRLINAWVEERTKDRIQKLLPNGVLSSDTRLVLVNAVYMNAPWASPFDSTETKPLAFHTVDETVDVPMMTRTGPYGYRRYDDHAAIAVPYRGGELQLLILLPDARDGLSALGARLTPQLLADAAGVAAVPVRLSLPQFRIESPSLNLRKALVALGMKTAFDIPGGSADFDRMAPRRPGEYLKISDVFHKTFIELDEAGTEAAAATAVLMTRVTSAGRPVEPVTVTVDRPFLFAIQHRASGACLFLGRVMDPRSLP